MRILATLVPLTMLAACGGDNDERSEPAATVTVTATPTGDPRSSATPTRVPDDVFCRTVLSESKAREVAGTAVKSPYTSLIGPLRGCRWEARDGSGTLGAATVPAGAWAKGLPAAIDSYRDFLESSFLGRESLKELEELLEQYPDPTDRQACRLFRIYIHAQSPDAVPEGSDVVTYFFPPEEDKPTQVVSGQSCVEGRFRSVAWGAPRVRDREAVQQRLENFLLSEASY